MSDAKREERNNKTLRANREAKVSCAYQALVTKEFFVHVFKKCDNQKKFVYRRKYVVYTYFL